MGAWPYLLKAVGYLVAVTVLAVLGYRFVRRRGGSILVGVLGALGLAIVTLAPVWSPYLFLPLPKDEVMIAHFRAHRPDIEEVVRRYREFVPAAKEDASTAWNRSPEVQAMMERAQLDRVTDIGPVWLPEPYSVETAQRVQEIVSRAKDFSLSRKYGSIKVDLSPHEDYWQELVGLDGPMWKELRFFPEPPRLEKGWLVYPPDPRGTVERSIRVLEDLNSYPANWRHGGCFARRIEAQWFVVMCMGAA